MIDLTLAIDDTLAGNLRALAAAQGISVDEAGRQALRAGLRQMTWSSIQPPILDLGPLHASPPSAEQIWRMGSPIVAYGAVPALRLTIIDLPQPDQPTHAN